MAAKPGQLVVLDINGVLLTTYRKLRETLNAVQTQFQPRIIYINSELICCVRPDAEKFLQSLLNKKAKIIVWSCCRRKKLMHMLDACFGQHRRLKYFAGKNALCALEVSLYVTRISNLLVYSWHGRYILTRGL